MFCKIFVADVADVLTHDTVFRNLLSAISFKLTYTLPFLLQRVLLLYTVRWLLAQYPLPDDGCAGRLSCESKQF